MKIHFGAGNASAEDYYYVGIEDCTLAGLGLTVAPPKEIKETTETRAGQIIFSDGTQVSVNDFNGIPHVAQYQAPGGIPPKTIQDTMWIDDWCWSCGTWTGFGFCHVVPAGTKDVMFNIIGTGDNYSMYTGDTLYEDKTDIDIQLFTMDGKHLAGTPLDDVTYDIKNYFARPEYHTGRLSEVSDINSYSPWLGFTEADYDGRFLNSGPADYDTGEVNNGSLKWTNYNGMRIGYSGDGNLNNDGKTQAGGLGYEVLVIDGEVTEDLLIWVPGSINVNMYKMHWDGGPGRPKDWDKYRGIMPVGPSGVQLSVATQEQAQTALGRIDQAVIKKDKVRAHLGAMQNRLANTITNLSIEADNLQAAEARISDVDVSLEMTEFLRRQILTKAGAAMLAQANAMPRMLMNLLRK